jgi:hypothetical protein
LLGFTNQEILQMLTLIEKWVSSSGEEWTVGRLKTLKTILIQLISGNEKPEASWIALTRQKVPKGPFKKLFKTALSTTDHRKINKSLSALMVYTGYISKNVTDKQYKKSIGSIESTDTLSQSRNDYLQNLGTRIAVKHIGPRKLNWRFYPASLNTGKPVVLPSWLSTGVSVKGHSENNDKGHPGDWMKEKYIESFLDGLSVPFVAQYLERKAEMPSAMALPPVWDDRVAASPGDIHVIQERGYKARVIAMPRASIQVALYPLHQLLNQILMNLETDCTHNQEDGARFAQKALQQRKTVYSVDLSGATDNFPIAVQIGVLKGLGLDLEANLFNNLSKSEWKLSKPLQEVTGKEYVTYTKGQHQGMYGSFALFSLTHNLVLTEMCQKLGIEPIESFRILGDDVIISDAALHKEYRDFLSYGKSPVSEDKCLTSSTHAEFAGFLITKDQYFKPAKVPNGNQMNGFMNYISVVGYGGLNNLPSHVRTIARKAVELPQDVGGLGLNPHGKPLKQRLEALKHTNELEVPKYVSLMSSLLALKYTQASDVFVDWLIEQMNHYERKVEALLQSHRLGSISTERHGLAFQLSLVYNDMQEPIHDYKHLAGNRNANKNIGSNSKQNFEDELTKWSRLLTKVDLTFDKYNISARKRRDKDWKKFQS